MAIVDDVLIIPTVAWAETEAHVSFRGKLQLSRNDV